MDYQKELKRLAADYQKYRRMQARKVKLQNSKPGKENLKPMYALLAQIDGHLKNMDMHAAGIMAELKKEKVPVVKSPANKHLVN